MGTSGDLLQRRLGQAIRRRREAIGLSQERLAEDAGIHRTYVSMIERGVSNPTLTVIASLAEALETSITALVRDLESRS